MKLSPGRSKVVGFAVLCGVAFWLSQREHSVAPAVEARKEISVAQALVPSSVVRHSTSSVAVVATETASPVVLSKVIGSLAEHLYDSNSDYEARDAALKQQLADVSASEWQAETQRFLSAQMSVDEGRSFLYSLKLLGEPAVPSLERIAASGVESNLPETRAQSERILRMQAIEQLDVLGASDSQKAQAAILKAHEIQNDPSLQQYLEIARLGIQQGKPGKLHRFFEEMTHGS